MFSMPPAWITWPSTKVSMVSGGSPARRRVSRTTAAPSTVAGVSFSAPPYVPIGVRTGAHRTISGLLIRAPCGEGGMVEDQASRGRMGVQLAVGADDAALGRGDLAPCMDHLAFGTH